MMVVVEVVVVVVASRLDECGGWGGMGGGEEWEGRGSGRGRPLT